MIYTITALYDGEGDPTKRDRRCFGWYDSLEKAQEAVDENRCDMRECYYDHIVIEELAEGIHCRCMAAYWYEWKDDKWQIAGCPKECRGLSNFGIG